MNRIHIITTVIACTFVLIQGCKNPPQKKASDQAESIPGNVVGKAEAGDEKNLKDQEQEVVNLPKKKAQPIPPPDDVAAPPQDAETTESGLASKVLKEGTGTVHPTEKDGVKVHYTGWTTDGRMFDSSVVRGKPISFSLQGVIAGWTEGVQLMVEGEKRRLWIPQDLAYKGRPGYPKGMLVFDIELLKILEPPATPENVAAPPDDAEKSESGLAWKVLKEGTGTVHPKPTDRVQVHYTGWTTDGQMFDSSVIKDKPASFPVNRVIAGWTEGVQLMVVGEKRRFWIPEDLAYKGKPGRPPGMLVFDIELLAIQ